MVKQQAEADGELNFGDVTINEGTRISLAGNKSMTALGSTTGGNVQMLADQTGGLNVSNENIDTSVNNFIGTNYIGDPLSKSLSKPSLLSIEDVKNKGYLMPSADRDWWLSDTGSKDVFSWRGYATQHNVLSQNTLKVRGETGGKYYDNERLAVGPYDYTKTVNLEKNVKVTTRFTLNQHLWGSFCKDGFPSFQDAQASCYKYPGEIAKGTFVVNSLSYYIGRFDIEEYNESSTWESSFSSEGLKPYHYGCDDKLYFKLNRTKLKKKTSNVWVAGTCEYNARDGFCYYPATLGKKLYGSFLLCITNDGGIFDKNKSYMPRSYVGGKKSDYYWFFMRNPGNITLTSGIDAKITTIPYVKLAEETVDVSKVEAASKGIRPAFEFDSSKIAFFSNQKSGGAEVSPTLGGQPVSVAKSGYSYKSVLKDDSLTLSANLNSSNITSDKGAVRIDENKIIVPFGTKTITLKNLSQSGGNCISALANNGGTLKYGKVSEGDEATIDITNLLHNKVTGANTQISLFAGKNSGDGYSDIIGSTPLTFTVEIGYGDEYNLTYDADGGSGASLPALQNVRAGSSVVLANGSLLVREGNPFSRWVVTYVEDGKNVNLLLNSGESFIMPTSDVVVVAQYSGIQIAKSTVTEGATNFIVTFDLNGGTLNGYSTTRIPIKVRKGEKIANPFSSEPVKGDDVFAGWYTQPQGGKKIDLNTYVVNDNITLYAIYGVAPDYTGDDVFLAPTGTDPYKLMKGEISVEAYSINTVKKAAEMLKEGANPNEEVFNATNDAWHLFAKISGTGSNVNDWLECRIIHTGQHDEDGSGLTFQAVHAWKEAFQWGKPSGLNQRPYIWKDCGVRSGLNASVWPCLPSSLRNMIMTIPKFYRFGKYEGGIHNEKSIYTMDNLWICSFTEIISGSVNASYYGTYRDKDGTTYDFWDSRAIETSSYQEPNEENRNIIKDLCLLRSKDIFTGDGGEIFGPSMKVNYTYLRGHELNWVDYYGDYVGGLHISGNRIGHNGLTGVWWAAASNVCFAM